MFVPLFLTGGALGRHSPSPSSTALPWASMPRLAWRRSSPRAIKLPWPLYFCAEATGGHAFIIPALIGAAVAYAVSGDASASADQQLHEGVKLQRLGGIPVSRVMQQQMVSVQASSSLKEFIGGLSHTHTTRHSRSLTQISFPQI